MGLNKESEHGFFLKINDDIEGPIQQNEKFPDSGPDSWQAIYQELDEQLGDDIAAVLVTRAGTSCFLTINPERLSITKKQYTIPVRTELGLTLESRYVGNRFRFGIHNRGCYHKGELWSEKLTLEGVLDNQPSTIDLFFVPKISLNY